MRFLDTLLPRLHQHNPQYSRLKAQAAKLQKGYNGECKLDYHLQLLADDFSILNDICLQYKQSTFQIDSLILSNHAIFIIDSKSIDGEITFDTNLQQLILTHKKQVTRFKYPITQLETIKFSLMKWLQHRKISSLPIYYYVSIADSSSILKIEGNDTFIREKVTFAENIPHYILQKNTQLSKQYKPNQQLKLNTIRTIMNEHQDLNIDIMKTFNIQPDDIRPGITCKKCRLLKTRYNYGSWTCTHCRYKDKKGYIRGIQDYFILFGNGISNKKARHFLQVPYKATMTRMLQRSNLVYNKKTKKWYRQ